MQGGLYLNSKWATLIGPNLGMFQTLHFLIRQLLLIPQHRVNPKINPHHDFQS